MRSTELARDAVECFARATQPCDNGFALGTEARSRGLVTDGESPTSSTAKPSSGWAIPRYA
jgi:hypothetical protein